MTRTADLRALVDGLGNDVIEVLNAPAGLSAVVGDPVIHDRVAGTGLAPSDVVLAVGVDARSGELGQLVEEAGAARAAAVIVKGEAAVARDTAERAHETGVALLRVADGAEWGQVHALIRMLVSVAPRASSDGEPALGDLPALANAIALQAGGPVTIEDARSRVLAYSTNQGEIDSYRRDTIVGRRVPGPWVERLRDDGIFAQVYDGESPVKVSYPDADPEYRDRLAYAVRAGGEVVGSVWIQEGDEPFEERHDRLLQEVGPLVALNIVQHLAGDVQRRHESELVRAVLQGRRPPTALADLLEPADGTDFMVVGLAPVGQTGAGATGPLNRMTSVVELVRRSAQVDLASTSDAEKMHVVVGAGGQTEAIVCDLVERCRLAVRVPLYAAMSDAMPTLDGLVAARTDVDDILRVVPRIDIEPTGVVRFDDVAGHVMLERWRDAARGAPELSQGRLSGLVAHDTEHRTEYVGTLRAFLDFGNVVDGAKAAGVHPNTFRYRLRRAADTGGLDLDDPTERLMLQLQMHLMNPSVGGAQRPGVGTEGDS